MFLLTDHSQLQIYAVYSNYTPELSFSAHETQTPGFV